MEQKFPAIGTRVVVRLKATKTEKAETIIGHVLRTYDGKTPTVIIDDTAQQRRKGSHCCTSQVSVPLELVKL